MDVVSDRWYIFITRVMSVFSAVMLVASAVALFAPAYNQYANRFGLSYITMGLAAAYLLAQFTIYKIIVRHSGLMPATLVITFLYMLNLVNLIHSSGRLHSWHHLMWIWLVFMSGIFGTLAIVGFCFLTLLYLLLIITEIPGSPQFEAFDLVAVAGVFIIGTASYFIWRRAYVNRESAQVAKLAGQLKSNQRQAETLIESIADGLIVINTDGKIGLMNPSAAKMTGWAIDEALGIDAHTVLNLKKENGQELQPDENPLALAFTKQAPTTYVLQLTSRSGGTIIVSLVLSPVILPKSKSISGAVAVLRDISTARAEEQQRADFISTASHEMRTPVAAIEGYLALALNDQVSKVDSKARSYLEKAHESTQHLGKLFQDLLTSARAEDGRLINHPVVVEMGTFVERLAEGLRFAAEKKGLLVDFVIGGSTEQSNTNAGTKVIKPLYYAHVDPDRMQEVVTNLFDNAVKYTESGKIMLGLTGNNEVVQLYVKDTGQGIPAEDIPHLFQKFYRVDSTATRTIGGTGLGLFISRKIVELYNGRIWAESELGKGTTFYINLPRLSTQKAGELMASEAAQSTALPQAPS